jgi:hypothetical protein
MNDSAPLQQSIRTTPSLVKRSTSTTESGTMHETIMNHSSHVTTTISNNNNNNVSSSNNKNKNNNSIPLQPRTPQGGIHHIHTRIPSHPHITSKNENDSAHRIGQIILHHKKNMASLDPDTPSSNDRKEIRYTSNIDFRPLALKACHMNVYNTAIKQRQQQPNYNEHQHHNNVGL